VDFKDLSSLNGRKLGETDARAVATVTKSSFARAYAEQFPQLEEAMKVAIGEAKAEVPLLDRKALLTAVRSTSTASFPGCPAQLLLWPRRPVHRSGPQAACSTCRPWWKAWRQPPTAVLRFRDLARPTGGNPARRRSPGDDLSKIQGRFRTKLNPGQRRLTGGDSSGACWKRIRLAAR